MHPSLMLIRNGTPSASIPEDSETHHPIEFRVKSEWLGAHHVCSVVEGTGRNNPFFLLSDAPREMQGEDTDAHAAEHFLHAISSSFLSTVYQQAKLAGTSITGMQSSISGIYTEEGFEQILFRYSPACDASATVIEGWLRKSPLFRNLHNSVRFSFDIQPTGLFERGR